ncbi:MAG: hypothetical protein IJZ80_05205, partial [Clostridia bacterium]|nr:hypothetical protein [Clostridia bacterium]
LDMTNCVFKGSLTAEGGYNGGMVGWQANGTLNLDKCLNAGDITGTTGDAGIVDYIEKGTCTIQNCANIGATQNNFVHSGTATTTDCISFTGAAGDPEIKTAIKQIRAMFPTMVFAANDDGTAIVVVDSDVVDTDAVAEAKFLQYKKTNNDTKMDIRVIGLLDKADLTGYANAGFILNLKQGNTSKYTDTVVTNTVYTSIKALDQNHEITTYTNTDLDAKYLYAVELYNIPTEGTFTIEVQAFVTGNGTTADSYDNLVVITVVDGVIQ